MSHSKPTTLAAIAEDLAVRGAYPWRPDEVDVVHTHASTVFLAGDYVLKLKKPVDFGFLDYSTRELRRHFCSEETRLNRRLAPDVYLGVAGVVKGATGYRVQLPDSVDLDSPDVEPAVLMRRLPETRTLAAGLNAGWVSRPMIDRLAKRLAEFHRDAERGRGIESFGHFDTVAGNARENFEQTREHRGSIVSPAVWQRCRDATEHHLARLRPTIEARAPQHTCETHGDLRLDHVYFLPEQIEVIDCIEFNERFRYSDAASDIAFLSMELRFAREHELAETLERAWAAAADDADAAEVLPFYVAYRSIVRAKVRGFLAADTTAPDALRQAAAQKALAHWLLALRVLEGDTDPSLVLVGGLPGTGKSTVAEALATRRGYRWIRADVVRKELAGLAADDDASAEFGAGIYTDAWTARTYARCEALARDALGKGERVVIDATFRDAARRGAFERIGAEFRIPTLGLVCEAPADVTRQRIRERTAGPSDASVGVYDRAAEAWVKPEGWVTLDTARAVEQLREAAVNALSSA